MITQKVDTPCIDHGCVGFGLGYATAWIEVDGVKYTTTKHRVVFYKLAGYLPEVVMHTCDNARCINPEHLVGGTYSDNMQDMLRKGRQGDTACKGMANGRAFLTPEDVQFIRDTYVKGSRLFGCVALAKQFGCGSSQIWRIVKKVQRNEVQ